VAECCCGSGEANLLYACSGAANTGFLADQVMRSLALQKVGKSTCLAAMGAELSGFVGSARVATRNIVIDGCPTSCGRTEITGELIEGIAGQVAARAKA
jgi:uncharacterized metal-binding protein